MADKICTQHNLHNRATAENCAIKIEEETNKPHMVKSNAKIEPEDETTFSVVPFNECFSGAIFKTSGEYSTEEYAQICAQSLERISKGKFECEAVLFEKTGWFSTDHYQTKCTQQK